MEKEGHPKTEITKTQVNGDGSAAIGDHSAASGKQGVAVGGNIEGNLTQIFYGVDTDDKPKQKTSSEKKSPHTKHLHKLSDRDDQVKDFRKFLRKNYFDCINRPHVFFLFGYEDDCHQSFIEGISLHHIYPFVLDSLQSIYTKGKKSKPEIIKPEWPFKEESFEERKRSLKQNLFQKVFNKWYHKDYKVEHIINHYHKKPILIICHNIDAIDWDSEENRLFEWYVHQYWNNNACTEDAPRIFIFMNIIYPDSILFQLFRKRKRIRTIDGIKQSICRHTPCLSLKELNLVTRKDVKRWFDSRVDIELDSPKINKHLKAIFKFRWQKYRMEKIEEELEKILKKYSIKMREDTQ